jgi:hypothetical protein
MEVFLIMLATMIGAVVIVGLVVLIGRMVTRK